VLNAFVYPVMDQRPVQYSSFKEESSDLIRPHRPVNPAAASRSHQELHKELQLTHKRLNREMPNEGKTELQRALEKRKWEQRMKASRDQEEAKKSTSPLHQELLKRHQRLENVLSSHCYCCFQFLKLRQIKQRQLLSIDI
uniref:Actin-associated protein FAM107A n=1 Tax=Salarias fasciatus TaxID=181472 RepID=A0A672IB58_SALFA